MGKKAARSSNTVIVKALRNAGLGKSYELPLPANVAHLKAAMEEAPHSCDVIDGVNKLASEYQIFEKPAKDAPKDAPKVELMDHVQFDWMLAPHEVVFYGETPTMRSMKRQEP